MTRSVKAEWCSSVTLYCAKHRFLPSFDGPSYSSLQSLSLSFSLDGLLRRTTRKLDAPGKSVTSGTFVVDDYSDRSASAVRTLGVHSTRIRRPSDWLCLLGKSVLHCSIEMLLDLVALPHDLSPRLRFKRSTNDTCLFTLALCISFNEWLPPYLKFGNKNLTMLMVKESKFCFCLTRKVYWEQSVSKRSVIWKIVMKRTLYATCRWRAGSGTVWKVQAQRDKFRITRFLNKSWRATYILFSRYNFVLTFISQYDLSFRAVLMSVVRCVQNLFTRRDDIVVYYEF